jgi:hypothetical protein
VIARWRNIRALLIGPAAVLLVACGTSVGSPPPALPSASPVASGPATVTQAPAATPEPPPTRELVVGCISVDDAECRFLAQQIVAVLPAERGPAFAVEIQLYACENPNAPCPKTLAARPGKAVVEFTDGGEPIDLTLKAPPLTPEITPQAGFYLGLTHPSSPRVVGGGPFPFEIGHCGVSHVIDFDGSFWVPIGQVDGDHPTIINAESGRMRLIAPNLAEFRGDSGFTVQLARFPGPKHFWGCD